MIWLIACACVSTCVIICAYACMLTLHVLASRACITRAWSCLVCARRIPTPPHVGHAVMLSHVSCACGARCDMSPALCCHGASMPSWSTCAPVGNPVSVGAALRGATASNGSRHVPEVRGELRGAHGERVDCSAHWCHCTLFGTFAEWFWRAPVRKIVRCRAALGTTSSRGTQCVPDVRHGRGYGRYMVSARTSPHIGAIVRSLGRACHGLQCCMRRSCRGAVPYRTCGLVGPAIPLVSN